MRRHASSGLTALLALTCVVLGMVIYHELRVATQPVPSTAAPVENPIVVSPEVPSAVTMPPQESFVGIVERPVFVASRRPVSDGETQGTSATFDLEVVGIVVSDGDRFVLVKAPGSDQLEPIREGQVVAGWAIRAIGIDHVRLRRGATELDVALDYTLPAPPSAPISPPQGQPVRGDALTTGEPDGTEPLTEEAPSQ
jgi:hypothetical protein